MNLRPLTIALTLLSLAPVAARADDYYYEDDYYYDDGYYDDGYYDDGYYDDGSYDGGGAQKFYMQDSRPGYEIEPQYQDGWEWDDGGYDYQPQYYRPNYNPYGGGGGYGGGGYGGGGYYRQPQVTYSNLPITIAMPHGEAGLCAYVLRSGSGSWNYTIAPGQDQTFKEDRAWQVQFDRGNGYGLQSYNLKPGLYRFRQSSRGWELYRSAN